MIMQNPTMSQIVICNSLENRWKELQQEASNAQKQADKANLLGNNNEIMSLQARFELINTEIERIESVLNFYDEKFQFENICLN